MSYDEKCFELAVHFLPKEKPEEWHYVAQVIQDAIEEELHSCKFCHRYFDDIEDVDEGAERICPDCDRQRDDARRDEALGL